MRIAVDSEQAITSTGASFSDIPLMIKVFADEVPVIVESKPLVEYTRGGKD